MCPGGRFLVHMIILFLVFYAISILFSMVAISIYIPTNSVQFFVTFNLISIHKIIWTHF